MNCHHVEAFKTMELDEVIWKRVNVLKKKKKKRTQAHGHRKIIINGITEKQKVEKDRNKKDVKQENVVS